MGNKRMANKIHTCAEQLSQLALTSSNICKLTTKLCKAHTRTYSLGLQPYTSSRGLRPRLTTRAYKPGQEKLVRKIQCICDFRGGFVQGFAAPKHPLVSQFLRYIMHVFAHVSKAHYGFALSLYHLMSSPNCCFTVRGDFTADLGQNLSQLL